MTVVYIVRHCESMANLSHSFAGNADVDISPKGAKQLECLKERFKNIKLDRVYSSHLIRARKTAEAINVGSGCEIEIDDSFIEMNLGIYDGKPVTCMTAEETYRWNNHPHDFEVPEGETMDEVCHRVFEGIKRVAKDNPDSAVAIASHGCAVRALIRQLRKLPREELKNVDWCDNTGVNKVIFYDDGNFNLEIENDSSHLSEDAKAESIANWNWTEE